MTGRHPSLTMFRAAVAGAAFAGGLWAAAAGAQEVTFKDDVYPILELRCMECHVPGGAGYEASGLDMRSYESLMEGTEHGPVVIPGNAFESNLVAVIDQRTDPELWMPHARRQISKCERLMLRFWINQGAKNN